MIKNQKNIGTKMKQAVIVFGVLLMGFISNAQSIDVKRIFSDAEKQTDVMLKEIPLAKKGNPALVSPRTLNANGDLEMCPSFRWVSGFFPGTLWYLYDFTHDKKWKKEAQEFTANIEKEKLNAASHDVGFKVYCSFGNGYRLTKDKAYKEIIIQAAKTLSTRFNPTVGCIRSWDTMPKWSFPVIIDNMLNLELLFAATRFSGDSSFYKIAVSHANATLKNHFRKDYSCYHVVDYDSTKRDGIIKKGTRQGYSDESAWARGQSWAVYGFTMCYRETKDPKYLQQAENVAGYILNHPNLPTDMIPYWDYDAPNIPHEQRDASAAACLASGLYELSTYSKNGVDYKKAADKIIENLTNSYRSPIGQNKGFILLHSTGARPMKSEVDVPLSYADYYYLEALLRSMKINEGKKR